MPEGLGGATGRGGRPVGVGVVVTVGALALLTTASCGRVDGPRQAPRAELVESAVEFPAAAPRFVVSGEPVRSVAEIRGQVESARATAVPAPVDGVVRSILAPPGSTVQVGDVLAELAQRPTEAELLRLEIETLELELAVIEGRLSAEEAEVRLDAASSGLVRPPVTVLSPVAGVVGRPLSAISSTVAAGDPLMPVGQGEAALVRATVPAEADIDPNVGEEVTVAADGTVLPDPVAGSITAVLNDDTTGDLVVEVRLGPGADPDELPVGTRVMIGFASSSGDRLWVPPEAIHRNRGRTWLVVVGPEASTDVVEVTAGDQGPGWVAVDGALSAGDEVIGP